MKDKKKMFCGQCERRVWALFPGGVCGRCFDFVAYATQPLPVVRNGDVDRERVLKSKRDCYHRKQKRQKGRVSR